MTRPEGSAAELEVRRTIAARLLDHGLGVREVAGILDVAPGSVSRWKATYEAEGIEGLAAEPHPGRDPKLTADQLATLEGILLDGPRAAGFGTDRWTLDRVVTVVEREFDAEISDVTAWNYLQELGWRYRQADPDEREGDAAGDEGWRSGKWTRTE